MKAFSFRLEKALRWRETQLNLQKSRVAGAAASVSGVEALIETRTAEAMDGAAEIIRAPTGIALAAYAGFRQKNRTMIRQLKEQLAAAKRAHAGEMEHLIEANRKLRLLENFKEHEQGEWRKDFERDLAAFADEAFLTGIQSKKRTGA